MLRGRPLTLQWGILGVISLVLVALLERVHFPAALLLGAMAAAIFVSAYEAEVKVPNWPFFIAQALIGCLMARSIGPGILMTIAGQWPVFLTCVVAVVLISTTLGGVLARLKVLPGTTAIWGSAPGAATVMVLMAEAFGGDIRLVAFMQYLRVAFVALVASIVARIAAGSSGIAPAAIEWFPAVAGLPLLETLALAVGGAIIGVKAKIPAGPLLVTLFAGIVLSGSHAMTITLPPWLMAGCYALVGWTIGLRFTREIVVYAARAFPRIVASILILIGLCGLLAYALHRVTGIDILTAYFATSPGGADSVAIIAAASKVNLPFVMAMQTARFMLVLIVGPSLSRAMARWTERGLSGKTGAAGQD
jgi:membrane AbrB-like protein